MEIVSNLDTFPHCFSNESFENQYDEIRLIASRFLL